MRSLCLFALAMVSLSALRAEDPASFEVGALTFQRPAAWQWIPVSSPMRKAELKIPGGGNQSCDITFFYFGNGQGGDVDANTQRWLHQFESAPGAEKIEKQEAGGAKLTFVSTEGTYHSGMPGGPTTAVPGQALLGVILENPAGNVFVKMTGPSALVKGSRAAFIDFVKAAAAAKK